MNFCFLICDFCFIIIVATCGVLCLYWFCGVVWCLIVWVGCCLWYYVWFCFGILVVLLMIAGCCLVCCDSVSVG